MPELFRGWDRHEDLCVLALASVLPDDSPRLTLEEADGLLQRMLAATEGARLRQTGDIIANTWRQHPDPMQLVEDARAQPPRRMQASEKRHPAFVDAQR